MTPAKFSTDRTGAATRRPNRLLLAAAMARTAPAMTNSLAVTRTVRSVVSAGGTPEKSREALVGSFCGLLELVKLGLVAVEQDDRRADIRIRLRPEHETDLESVVRDSLFDDELPVEPAPQPPPAPAG